MKKGFTLIELLVAVAIIGVIAAVGVISFNKFIESSKIAATKENHNSISNLVKTKLSQCRLSKTVEYLDTNGGSVSAGARIVDEVQKYNLNCIAHKAYSMGFVILQACNKRFVTPYSSVMQHQISYGVANEKAKVESYVNFVDQIGEKLDKMQAKKIGLEYETFKKKTYNDWWLSGDNIIYENVADEIVNVKCSKSLTNRNYTIDNGYQEQIYSRCPLVNEPIEVKNNGQELPPFVFWL